MPREQNDHEYRKGRRKNIQANTPVHARNNLNIEIFRSFEDHLLDCHWPVREYHFTFTIDFLYITNNLDILNDCIL